MILVFLLLGCLVSPGESQSCTSSKTVGNTDLAGSNVTLAGTTDINYIAHNYVIDCCAVVTGWQAFIATAGEIRFQILRAKGAGYELVVEHVATFTAADQVNRVQTITLPSTNRINAQKGDILGWYTKVDMIPYKPESGSNAMGKSPIAAPAVGAVTSFTETLSGRSYAINVQVIPNEAPKFTNLPKTKDYPDTGYTVTIYSLAYTDPEGDSVSLTYDSQDPEYRKYYSEMRANEPQWKVGTVQTSWMVTDTCGSQTVSTLTVIVYNTPPDITNLPTTTDVEILETITTETKLLELDITDKQKYTCEYTGSEPFACKLTGGKYAVYYTGASKLDHTKNSVYNLDITVTDELKDANSTTTKTLTVNVLENKTPDFKAGTLPTTITISAKNTKKDDPVFTVEGVDPESDTMYYSLPSCLPQDTCPFTISKVDGKITAIRDLAKEKVTRYNLEVQVDDTHTTSKVGLLEINLNDINYIPTVTNIPTGWKKTIKENAGKDVDILQVAVSDDNAADKHTYSVTFTNGGEEYFAIDNNGLIKTIKDINFEELNGATTFTAKVIVNDGLEDSEEMPFTIEVEDVNEPQTGFSQSTYVITGATEIPSSFKDVVSLTDPDAGDVQTYSITCPNGHDNIKIDSKTAEIKWTSQIDLDVSNVESTTITCEVTAVDKGGHTTKTNVEIQVTEINDKDPTFTTNAPLTYTIPITSGAGTTFGSFDTNDADIKAENKDTAYSVSGTDSFTVTNGRQFQALDISKYSAGQSVTFNVVATNTKPGVTDSGGQVTRSATKQVTVIFTDVTTTTTAVPVTVNPNTNTGTGTGTGTGTIINFGGNTGSSTGSGSGFLNKPENLGWFVPTMIALVGMLGLLGYMIFRILRNPNFFSKLNLCKGLRSKGLRGFNCKDRCNCNKVSQKSPPKAKVQKPQKPQKPFIKEGTPSQSQKPLEVRDPDKMNGKYDWNVWCATDFNDKIGYR